MTNFYIDESGSLTRFNNVHPLEYFVISLIQVNDLAKFKKTYKRFVSKYLKNFKDKDDSMFRNWKFFELKGSSFTPYLKRKFVEHFIRDDSFKVHYIKVDNKLCHTKLLENKARAFNFILKNFFQKLRSENLAPDNHIRLQIDERNVRPNAKYFLAEYLNTELCVNEMKYDKFEIDYYQSENNKLIQIADVFSNIYYSNIVSGGKYDESIELMRKNNILTLEFLFPTN